MIRQIRRRNNATDAPATRSEFWIPSAPRGTHLMELMEKWKVADALETYGVRHWGKGYFSVNKAGHVTVLPTKQPDQAIDLKELIDNLQARGIQLPILLRFTDILRHRVG